MNPKNALSSCARESTPLLLKLISMLPRIVHKEKENEIQILDDQWRSLPLENLPKIITEEKDTDKFWVLLLNFKHEGSSIAIYKELSEFVLSILSLPHSNAECERLFSKVNRTKTKSRNSMITSTVSASLMTSECISNSNSNQGEKGTCFSFELTKKMLKLMNSDNLYKNENVNHETNDFTLLFHSF